MTLPKGALPLAADRGASGWGERVESGGNACCWSGQSHLSHVVRVVRRIFEVVVISVAADDESVVEMLNCEKGGRLFLGGSVSGCRAAWA